MEVKLLTADEEVARAFAERGSTKAGEPSVSGIQEMPGATGGWYEIALAWGAIGLPAAVIANVLSQFIWETLQRRKKQPPPGTKIKLVIREGEKVADLEIETSDPEAIQTAIGSALRDADRPS